MKAEQVGYLPEHYCNTARLPSPRAATSEGLVLLDESVAAEVHFEESRTSSRTSSFPLQASTLSHHGVQGKACDRWQFMLQALEDSWLFGSALEW